MRRVLEAMVGNRWEVRRTIWPYEEGYGVYHPRRRVVLETGLTKELAQAICNEQNQQMLTPTEQEEQA